MRVLMSWSSGKDSAWALHRLRQDPAIEVVGLLTTVNAAYDRVAMHGVRASILQMQADALGLPIWRIDLPDCCSNLRYEEAMHKAMERAVAAGVQALAFGDLFLEDIREYRECLLEGSGLQPLFPIWREPTTELAHRMIASGVRAILTCVDTRQLPALFAGRDFNAQLLDDLPEGVDRCGERGEFHTVVYAGPLFPRPLPLQVGQRVERNGFMFADVLPL